MPLLRLSSRYSEYQPFRLFQVCRLFVFVNLRLCFIARNISRKKSLLLAQIKFNSSPQRNTLRVKKQGEKRASVNMIVLIILLFVLCHVGGNYRCFFFVFKHCFISENLKNVIHVLFIMNSAVNPLVYAVLKKDMKNELKKLAVDRHCHCWQFFAIFVRLNWS